MIGNTSEAGTRGKGEPGNLHQVSRREFIRLSLISAAGLGIYLTGCTPSGGNNPGIEDKLAVSEEWLNAVNAGDATQFEELHTESVTIYPDFSKNPFSGRDQVWKYIGQPISGQLEKISAFGQDQAVCLQVTVTETGLSLCYVFEFVDSLIDKVYEYYGEYVFSPQEFGGLPFSVVEDLPEYFDIVESTIEQFNNQDIGYVREYLPDFAVKYVPNSPEPLIGREAIIENTENFHSLFPDAIFKITSIFGQGNLICAQLSGENMVRKSFCFVYVVDDGKIPETYQYHSRADVQG